MCSRTHAVAALFAACAALASTEPAAAPPCAPPPPGWGNTERISTIEAGKSVKGSPKLAINPAGDAFILYRKANSDLPGDLILYRWKGSCPTSGVNHVVPDAQPAYAFEDGAIRVAADAQGNAMALWTRYGAGLAAVRYTPQAGFGPTRILTTGSHGPSADIGIDAAGNALVAYLAGGALTTQRYTVAGGWQASPTVVETTALSANAALTVSAQGDAWLAFITTAAPGAFKIAKLWRTTVADNSWLQVPRLFGEVPYGGPSYADYNMRLANDNAGQAMLMLGFGTVTTYRFDGSAWSYDGISGATMGAPMAMNANGGRAVALFSDAAHNLYARRYVAGAPVSPADLLGQQPTSSTFDEGVAIDDAGNIIAAWRASGYVYARRYNNQCSAVQPPCGWSSVVYLGHSSTSEELPPRVAMWGNGNAIVTWTQNGAVYTRRFQK